MCQKLAERIASHGVLSAFNECASLNGDKIALRFNDITLTYSELHSLVNKIAVGLHAQGVTVNSKVAVSVSRSQFILPLLLAIWKCRSAYIPVDPNYPQLRKAYILSDSGAEFTVVDDAGIHESNDGQCIKLAELLSSEGSVAGEFPVAADEGQVLESDTAYIIYTSGSTGNPKGVVVSQANVANFIASMAKEPGLHRDDTLLAVTTISFDIHVLELFLPIAVGAEVVIASEKESISQASLQRIIDDDHVTIMQATPTTWRMLLTHGWTPKTPLKMLVGGEKFPADLLVKMHAGSSSVWNMYGPTETTVWSTCYRFPAGNSDIFIGHPIRGTDILVVNEALEPVRQGEPGELLIGGSGVTMGYYNKPELTQAQFVRVPTKNKIFYRTGDLVLEHETEGLKYLDRIDNQIKIRGFRIEPGDIESCIAAHPHVQQSTVVAADFNAGDMRLVCFYTGEKLSKEELSQHAMESMPRHMLPQYFLHLDEFPKTDNLKINRKELINIAPRLASEQTVIVASVDGARNELERCLIDVWENVLGVKGINIDSSFFDLGGHSLLVFDLVKKMSIASGVNFSADSVFVQPTIRALTNNEELEDNKDAVAIKLNTTKKGIPVYCLCGVHIYSKFAGYLADQHPVYGVFGKEEIALLKHESGLLDGAFSKEKFIDSYINAIQRQNEDNSEVILAGFSFGGLLAMEVAKKMQQQGIKIKLLVMIDSYSGAAFFRSVPLIFLDKIKRFFGANDRREVPTIGEEVTQDVKTENAVQNEDATILDQQERERSFEIAAKSFGQSVDAYDGNVILAKAENHHLKVGVRPKPDYGWSRYVAGDFHVVSYPVEHLGVLKGEAVALLAKEVLNKVQVEA